MTRYESALIGTDWWLNEGSGIEVIDCINRNYRALGRPRVYLTSDSPHQFQSAIHDFIPNLDIDCQVKKFEKVLAEAIGTALEIQKAARTSPKK